MSGPAPTELVHLTEKDTEQLHSKVGDELKNVGQPTDTIPAHERPVIGEDLGYELAGVLREAGSSADQIIHGQKPDTGIVVTQGKKPGRWVLDRIKRLVNK